MPLGSRFKVLLYRMCYYFSKWVIYYPLVPSNHPINHSIIIIPNYWDRPVVSLRVLCFRQLLVVSWGGPLSLAIQIVDNRCNFHILQFPNGRQLSYLLGQHLSLSSKPILDIRHWWCCCKSEAKDLIWSSLSAHSKARSWDIYKCS